MRSAMSLEDLQSRVGVLGATKEIDDQDDHQNQYECPESDGHDRSFRRLASVLVSALLGLVRLGFDAGLVGFGLLDRDLA